MTALAGTREATRFIAERLQRRDSLLLVAEAGDGSLAGFCQVYPTLCSLEAARSDTLHLVFR